MRQAVPPLTQRGRRWPGGIEKKRRRRRFRQPLSPRSTQAAPHRVQLRRSKGWRMPPNTVKVDRSTRFGNPLLLTQYGRKRAIALFRAWIMGRGSRVLPPIERLALAAARRDLLDGLPNLRGKNLACWCPLPAAGRADQCHAAVLLDLANR